jgi:ribonuclease HI
MATKKDFEIFLYKNKINSKTLIDILPQLSSKTISNLYNDLEQLRIKVDECKSKNTDKNTDKLCIFTDGGAYRNGKPDCKAAYSVLFTEESESIMYKFNTTRMITKDPSNNKAELSAIKYVYKIIYENADVFENKKIVICSDSEYSINCITKWSSNWIKNDWRNSKGECVKNQDIIKKILDYEKTIRESGKNIEIEFKHVFSHTQEPDDKNSQAYFLWYGNNYVDKNIGKILNMKY